MKIDCLRQHVLGRTDGQSDSLSSCRSQKPRIYEGLTPTYDGDITHDGEAVIRQPLGGRGPALEDICVNKLPESPGVRLGFELCEGGLDPVLFVLGRVQDGELVPGLDLGLGLVAEVHREVALGLGGVALGDDQ